MQVVLRELIHEYERENRPQFHCAADIALELRFIKDQPKEFMVVFFLDTKHKVLAREIVSIGIINASLIHPREVFRSAIHINAHSIALGHNHPSGEAKFSADDNHVTELLSKAGELLGIELLDHVVVGEKGYESAKETGILKRGSC